MEEIKQESSMGRRGSSGGRRDDVGFSDGELEKFDEALEAASDSSKPDVQKKWSIPAGVDPEGGHFLSSGYTFWFVRRSGARSQENYANAIKRIGGFRSIEGFWKYYNHLVRPHDLPNTSDYHLFKEGIKPMWEDDANKRGGKWIIRLKKGLATKYWEDLLLAIVGEQFQVGDEICGIVCSIRFNEDILSVWNKSADNKQARLKIHETLKTVLNLPPNTPMEYKCHDDSIRDNSSFRNTDIYR
ncbi:Eukaryotic initiation factor 4E [Acanthamoeba castellanii str. Neff]|uniref:Eukaryotic initiation factor 4E n=1 Tax=Acanthamoeba castellanii (strain ATCC 30010 / Neff) TaxID=1257118 RepID=L8H0E9_ACACF|nr:Eukaryotic initiation factor 4E [Acanthamoeba castellanii str. Neff]ELR18705.1 Eukaryotic initiation factor 4E [Acanthamoeba castellanii str. Neff]